MKTFIDNSVFLEGVCELADQRVKEKFGDSGYITENEESRYSEDAQDYFNEVYSEIETTLNNIMGIFSDIDKNNTVLSTLNPKQVAELQDAKEKVSIVVLEWLAYGEEKDLNETFKLYHYCEEDIVVIGFRDDDVENWEVLQVQWDKETNLIVFEEL